MINLVNFLLLLEKIVDYNKKDIDRGNTPSQIYNICSCIREAFCLSYNIRKNNDLYLYFQIDNVLIKFQGNRLKFLGPDERSQALLLNKAIVKTKQSKHSRGEKWMESTPGIYGMSLKSNRSLILYLKSMDLKNLIMVFDAINIFDLGFLAHTYDYPKIKKLENIKDLQNSFLIIPINTFDLIKLLKLIAQIFPSMLEKITITALNKIKTDANKILYINYQIDKIDKIL